MKDFILVLCWLGVAQSILLGVYFISTGNKRSYLFLGVMMLMIGIRVAKSTIYLFDPHPPLIIMNIGFAAHAMLGPLFLFYIQTLISRNLIRLLWLHFLPAFMIIFLSPYLSLNEFWYRGGYSALLYYTLIYLIIAWYLFIAHKENKGWVIYLLLITITIFQISYFSNYILRLTPYETGAVMHSLLIYAISFLVLKNNDVFSQEKKKKYDNLNVSPQEVERYKEKLLATMEERKPYLDPDFSLSKCADLTGIPSYMLSYVLSERLNQNFLRFINAYRIEEAKKLLVAHDRQHLSIAGISHDCGFNTVSSFNAAFKKFVGVTPSDYRKKVMA